MIKNNIERIIFVAMIGICLYSIVISGFREKEAYNTAGELQTEIALIENVNNILRNKIEILELDKQLLNDEIEDLKDFRDVLSKSSYIGDFEVTYYTANFESTGKTPEHPEYGITKSGEPVKEDYTISADWAVLPKNSVVYVENIGVRVVQDTGSAIVDKKIDVYEPNIEIALSNGRHMAGVYVIEWGEIDES